MVILFIMIMSLMPLVSLVVVAVVVVTGKMVVVHGRAVGVWQGTVCFISGLAAKECLEQVAPISERGQVQTGVNRIMGVNPLPCQEWMALIKDIFRGRAPQDLER